MLLLVFVHRHTCTRDMQSLMGPKFLNARSYGLMDRGCPELDTG